MVYGDRSLNNRFIGPFFTSLIGAFSGIPRYSIGVFLYKKGYSMGVLKWDFHLLIGVQSFVCVCWCNPKTNLTHVYFHCLEVIHMTFF